MLADWSRARIMTGWERVFAEVIVVLMGSEIPRVIASERARLVDKPASGKLPIRLADFLGAGAFPVFCVAWVAALSQAIAPGEPEAARKLLMVLTAIGSVWIYTAARIPWLTKQSVQYEKGKVRLRRARREARAFKVVAVAMFIATFSLLGL